MDKVTLDKTGIYFDFWDEESEDWITRNIVEGSLPITWYLDYPIQFKEVISCREFVKILESHKEVINLVMAHALSGIEFEEILKIANDQAEAKEISPTGVYLIRIADAIPTSQGDEEFNFLNSYPVLMGLEEVDEIGDNDELHSLSSISFTDWRDLPLSVDDYVEFVNPITEEVLFEGIMNWTLRDMVSTILGQISITLLVNQATASVSSKKQVESGPIEIHDVFDWIDDLDKIFLK
jgi:hypothetical protein